jgi:hypothetical protein
MIKSQKNPPKPLLRATAPRQVSIAFESIGLWGLRTPERMKAVMHLAYLLMLAAGVADEEPGDER